MDGAIYELGTHNRNTLQLPFVGVHERCTRNRFPCDHHSRIVGVTPGLWVQTIQSLWFAGLSPDKNHLRSEQMVRHRWFIPTILDFLGSLAISCPLVDQPNNGKSDIY